MIKKKPYWGSFFPPSKPYLPQKPAKVISKRSYKVLFTCSNMHLITLEELEILKETKNIEISATDNEGDIEIKFSTYVSSEVPNPLYERGLKKHKEILIPQWEKEIQIWKEEVKLWKDWKAQEDEKETKRKEVKERKQLAELKKKYRDT